MGVKIIERAENLIEEQGEGWPIISTEEYSEVPFFGKIIKQVRDVNGVEMDYYNILRHFGWSVVFGLTKEKKVITLIQWKPGVNKGSWELPPGGIGKIKEEASVESILKKTQDAYLCETGYGKGSWANLGSIMIESGKYRGATSNSHGLKAHLWLAIDLEKISEASHASEEKIELLLVEIDDFREILKSGLFNEASAVVCTYKSLLKIGYLSWR